MDGNTPNNRLKITVRNRNGAWYCERVQYNQALETLEVTTRSGSIVVTRFPINDVLSIEIADINEAVR